MKALREGRYESISYADYAARCRAFAGALLAEGLEPGDAVAIMGDNSPEWVIADVGAMMARAVPAGIYQTSTPEQFAYVAGHCEAKVLVLHNETYFKKFAAQRDGLPQVRRVVLVKDAEKVQDPLVVSFADFLAKGQGQEARVDVRFREVQDDDLATLIYTSGTTGPPKGAMLSHRNMAYMAATAAHLRGPSRGDAIVSYLPLSHIAEQMFTIHLPAKLGGTVVFAEGLEKLKEALLEGRPTIFLGVPRVWEKFKGALEGKLAEAKGLKRAIIDWSRQVGLEGGLERLHQGDMSLLTRAKYTVADRLFFSKLKAQLGLDRLELAVTGAAPVARDVLEFFLSCGILVHEVYGQTEAAGATTFNRPSPKGTRLGTVGLPLPGTEVKIADDGEIVLKGPGVFLGYYKEKEATKATLVDGWLLSGDVGQFDEGGFLRITDRKKDLIITSGGKNVAPQNIEKKLKTIDGVSQAVVIGDKRHYLSALLTVDAEQATRLAREKGWPVDLEALAKHPAFRGRHDQRPVGALRNHQEVCPSAPRLYVGAWGTDAHPKGQTQSRHRALRGAHRKHVRRGKVRGRRGRSLLTPARGGHAVSGDLSWL
jgi:long-chain acyl-CoA synthetase